jgi:NAD(P)-dependent dehydrogenase (short-subunit alcohol dehydrogenase family)
MAGFDPLSMGDLSGRRVVITGANSGIGLEAARVLLAQGADVVLACRDLTKAKGAIAALGSTTGRPEARQLDLADQESIKGFAGELSSSGQITDLLNNAAVMACPLSFTKDGLELQMGTNHFGHALLTALLLPALAEGARVVFVSSIAARRGRLTASTTAEDLTSPAPYSAQGVYSNAKQANLLYSQELDRRLKATSRPVASLACHPGVSATELFLRQLRDNNKGYLVPLARPVLRTILQPASAGAWPSLMALGDPSVTGGEFIGPRLPGQLRGRPGFIEVFRQGADEKAAARLFQLTEEILGVDLLGAA